MTRRLCTITLALGLGVFTMAACSSPAPEDTESEAAVPVTTATASAGDITATMDVTGLVTPAPGAALAIVAPEAARIVAIPRATGDLVRRGDLLVRFDIPSSTAELARQQAEIRRAEAGLAAAQAAETRMQDLYTRGVAARREVEDAVRAVADAQAALASARASAQAAETAVDRSTVRATFDGIVSARTHDPGDLVDPGSGPILQVVDPNRLEVVAQIPLADVSRVRVGASAHVRGTNGTPGPALKVVSRPAAVQDAAATVPVRLAFTTPAPYPVGSPVEVAIDAETHHGVTIVPAAAVVHEGGEAAVFVASGGKAVRRDVHVGLQDDEHVELVSGVKAGEVVIVTNQNGLPDGAAITVARP
jgi:RND family efflux transporter MFP subunit